MSRVTIFPGILLLALLTGCQQTEVVPLGGGGSMDTPIVVSDDLHVRHAHHKSGSADDFRIQPNGQVTSFSDSGKEINSIQCKNMTVVGHTSTYPDCTAGYDVRGGKLWKLDVYASTDGSGSSLMTLTPSASMPPCSSNTTVCVVTAAPNNGVFGATQDGSNDAPGGTDLTAYDGSGNPLSFASVKLTDSATSNSAVMKCNNPGHDCKIKIVY